MRRLWRWFLAWMRLDLKLVCELSKGRSMWDDYHDYPDTKDGDPDHFSILKCARCGKSFLI